MTKYFIAKVYVFGDDEDLSEETMKDDIKSALDTSNFLFPNETLEEVYVKQVTLEEYTTEEKNGEI